LKTQKKKGCKSDPHTMMEILPNTDKPFEPEYCQVLIHHSGNIQVRGDDKTVNVLREALQGTGYKIRWDYMSPCG